MSVFLDTNVLLYAVGSDQAEAQKREIARALLARDDVHLSLQVFQEFVWQATRPHKGPRLSFPQAFELVALWRRFPVQETTLPLFEEGAKLMARYRLSFWDSMIVAAARAQGCALLYSEDMQDGRILDGLRIVNPFS